MTQLLNKAINKAHALPIHEQDVLASASVARMQYGDNVTSAHQNSPYCIRATCSEGEAVRIIGARLGTKFERNLYEKN